MTGYPPDSSQLAWFTSPETTPRNRVPDNHLVRFVAHNPAGRALDIGSGSGANARYLSDNGFAVVTLDSAPAANAYICGDIREIVGWKPSQFDYVFDINTLCHVEQPPYEGIRETLKPKGKFFSVHPAIGTEQDFGGKGYTRVADREGIRELLGRGFNKFTVRKFSCWIIEAER